MGQEDAYSHLPKKSQTAKQTPWSRKGLASIAIRGKYQTRFWEQFSLYISHSQRNPSNQNNGKVIQQQCQSLFHTSNLGEECTTSMALCSEGTSWKVILSFASSLEMFRIKSREEQTCDTFYASVPLEKEPTRVHIQATVLSYFLLDVIIQRKTTLKGRKIYFGSIWEDTNSWGQ